MFKFTMVLLLATSLGLGSAVAHEKHCEDTDLGAKMSEMKKANKKLKKAIRSEDFEEVIGLSARLKELGTESAKLKPLKHKGQDAQFNALQAEYRDYYEQLSVILGNIEQAAREGSGEKLSTLYRELNDNKKKAHKSFKKDCD